MKISPYFEKAQMLRRYKRFLVDVKLENGEELTIYCPNTGSMKNCWVEGGVCWFSRTDNPNRKLSGTLELTITSDGFLCGINTHRSNHLVKEGIKNGIITISPDLHYAKVVYGTDGYRYEIFNSASLVNTILSAVSDVSNIDRRVQAQQEYMVSSEKNKYDSILTVFNEVINV